LVQTDEERKAKRREEAREYRKSGKYNEYHKEYRKKPEVKAKTHKYNLRPEVKAKRVKYQRSPEALAKIKEYRKTPEYQTKRKERENKPEYKARRSELQRLDRTRKRSLILHHYSKILSNSDVPCCNCCGENFHIDFLAIDHIAGKRQMDSEPELKKLGYSSKLDAHLLWNWLVKNNFPDGFQVLCINCNFAKGMTKNNNTCPHEKAQKEETFAMMEEQSSFEAGF
jgi:hypothetical protein